MKKIKLNNPTEYIKEICKTFANECIKTNFDEYSKRNQNHENKIKKDIYLGKIAEFLVFEYLLSKKKKCTPPDICIYDFKNKSFDSDLIILNDDNLNIHVKSHDLTSTFPASWVFQPNDPLVLNPNSWDYLALCLISKDENFMYLVKAEEIKNLYRDPIKEDLNKRVLYEEDLISE